MNRNLYCRKSYSSQAKLGEKVRMLRKEKGISQEELAFRMEMSARSLSDIETGKANCHLSTLCALALALEISLAELLTFDT